jgi:hypothetical protein
MIVPDPIVQFLQGPVVSYVGTRNEKLRPHVQGTAGSFGASGSDTVTFFLPEVESEQTLDNLRRNGQLSFTVADGPTHQSFQLKGRFKAARAGTAAEAARQAAYIAALTVRLRPMLPDEAIMGFIFTPFLAVTFQVESIWDQTPGPKAGGRVGE